jgi:hypothetical protein
MSSQDQTEHPFDQVVRIGFGLPVIKYLFEHEASALACVNQQSAEAVRWQREKGNLVPVWSEDDKGHVTLRYNNKNITTDFPVIKISLKTLRIDPKSMDQSFTKYNHLISNGTITVTNNKIYVITFYGKFIKDDDDDPYGRTGYYSRQKDVVIDYAYAKFYYDTSIPFKKQHKINRDMKEAAEKLLEIERRKAWFTRAREKAQIEVEIV